MSPHHTISVLLRHTLPSGDAHFDWLIERPTPAGRAPVEHRMISFRCDTDPLEKHTHQTWTGARMTDHRAHYLAYEGPVSGDRGEVSRVWRIPVRVIEESPERIRLQIIATPHEPHEPRPITLVPIPTAPQRESNAPEPTWTIETRAPRIFVEPNAPIG